MSFVSPCLSRIMKGYFTINNSSDWIFVAGSGMLGISIALNAVSTQ